MTDAQKDYIIHVKTLSNEELLELVLEAYIADPAIESLIPFEIEMKMDEIAENELRDRLNITKRAEEW